MVLFVFYIYLIYYAIYSNITYNLVTRTPTVQINYSLISVFFKYFVLIFFLKLYRLIDGCMKLIIPNILQNPYRVEDNPNLW